MSLDTYWLNLPLADSGLSAFGWLVLWVTRPPGKRPGKRGMAAAE
jgi:hypothetical protein